MLEPILQDLVRLLRLRQIPSKGRETYKALHVVDDRLHQCRGQTSASGPFPAVDFVQMLAHRQTGVFAVVEVALRSGNDARTRLGQGRGNLLVVGEIDDLRQPAGRAVTQVAPKTIGSNANARPPAGTERTLTELLVQARRTRMVRRSL